MRYKVIAIAFWVLLRKEIKRFLRIWSQTILPPMVTTILYFVIFGQIIGPQVQAIHNFTYMQFIAGGLIMLAIITNSYSNVSNSLFIARFQHNIEELIVSPIPNIFILLGYVMGGVLRGLLIGILITVLTLKP